MSRFAQIVAGAVLTLVLLLWSAVWWVTREQPLRESANVGTPPPGASRVTDPFDAGQRRAIPAPTTAQEQTPTTVPSSPALIVHADSSAGQNRFKPQTEPISPPLPPPLRPNGEG